VPGPDEDTRENRPVRPPHVTITYRACVEAHHNSPDEPRPSLPANRFHIRVGAAIIKTETVAPTRNIVRLLDAVVVMPRREPGHPVFHGLQQDAAPPGQGCWSTSR